MTTDHKIMLAFALIVIGLIAMALYGYLSGAWEQAPI